MIWRVPCGEWANETAFLLAGGPSLLGFNAEVLRGAGRVVTVNDSWRLAPWAAVHYFCDASWYHLQLTQNRHSTDGHTDFHTHRFEGFWVSGSYAAFDVHPYVRALRLGGRTGLSDDPAVLRHGSNSGYQAINLAYLYGALRIILLGYDMHVVANRTHWHNESRPDDFAGIMRNTMLPTFETLVEPLARAGVEVVNATPGSAISCWPCAALADVLSVDRNAVCRA